MESHFQSCVFIILMKLSILSFILAGVEVSAEWTLDKCVRGSPCQKCPKDRVNTGHADVPLCCDGCERAPVIGRSDGNCICAIDTKDNETSLESRILFRPSTSRVRQNSLLMNRNRRKTPDNKSMMHAIVLITEAIEKIDLRLRRVEESLGQINFLNFGEIPISDQNALRRKKYPSRCDEMFVEVGEVCIFASIFTNQRANWQDAQGECKKKGATLAEVPDRGDFSALSKYLSTTTVATGYSYWLGSIYPGGIWIWLDSRKHVSLNPEYWTVVRKGMDSPDASVVPGSIENGRCLVFHYVLNKSIYKLAGDECGYEKFFLCQKPLKDVKIKLARLQN